MIVPDPALAAGQARCGICGAEVFPSDACWLPGARRLSILVSWPDLCVHCPSNYQVVDVEQLLADLERSRRSES